MTKQTINVGSTELAGDGESIRSAFVKINNNFNEVYSRVPLATTATYAQSYDPAPVLNYLAANTSTSVVGNATKIVNGTWTLTLSTAGSILLNGTVFQGGGGGLTDRLTAGNKSVILDTDGNLTLPAGGSIYGLNFIGGEGTNVQTDQTINQVIIQTYNTSSHTSKEWTFDNDGNLTSPQGTVLGYSDPGGFIIDGAGNKDVSIYTYNSGTAYGWVFGTDGLLTLPDGSQIQNGFISGAPGQAGGVTNGGTGYQQLFAQDDGVWVQTSVHNSGTDFNSWTFGTDGKLTVPDDIRDANGSVIRVATTSTAPTRVNGQLWFNTEDGRTYIKYNNQWVDANPTLIPAPNTYLDDIEIEDSTIYINGSTLTISTSGTLLVNGEQVTGSGGGGDRLTSGTSSLIYLNDGTLFTTGSLFVSSFGTSTYSAFGWANSFNASTKAAGILVNSPFDPSTGDLFVYTGDVYGPFTNQIWTFGHNGVLTLSTASTILGASTDPNVYIETSTTSTTSTWTFGTNGVLTLPAHTPVIKGGGTGTDVIIVASDGTTTSSWTVGLYGDLTHNTNFIGSPSSVTISSSRDISLESTIAGIPTGVANWNGGGGWNQGSYINTATTGGSGTGLTVNVAAGGGGYINISAISIANPGSGYTDGDVITINNENNIPGTFTISVTDVSKVWTFSNTGTVRFSDNTVQHTAYTTGQITIALNGTTEGGHAGYTVNSIADANVIYFIADTGYSNSTNHIGSIPSPSYPGQKLTLINDYINNVDVVWPFGESSASVTLAAYDNSELTAFNHPTNGLSWWETNRYAW